MSSIAYGQTEAVYCHLAGTITVTPSTGTGRISIKGQTRDGVEFVNQTVTAATTFDVPAGSTVSIGVIGCSATYSSTVSLLAADGGVVGLSEVMPEVLATATATSTQVTGAGTYGWYRCTTATGNITVYDNTAASGKVLVPTTALAVGVFPIGGAGNSTRLAVSTGVTTVLSGAGVVYIGCETA